jgi:hypothetical protein
MHAPGIDGARREDRAPFRPPLIAVPSLRVVTVPARARVAPAGLGLLRHIGRWAGPERRGLGPNTGLVLFTA